MTKKSPSVGKGLEKKRLKGGSKGKRKVTSGGDL